MCVHPEPQVRHDALDCGTITPIQHVPAPLSSEQQKDNLTYQSMKLGAMGEQHTRFTSGAIRFNT